MKIAYLDCSAGISGNMFLGALINLGLPQKMLYDELGKLPIHLPDLSFETVSRKGIQATLFEFKTIPELHHRHLSDIIAIIEKAGYDQKVTNTAIHCFKILAEAEAKIHGIAVEEVHFHEVGAMDAIVDIIGSSIGINYFNIQKVITSPIRVGFGSVSCAHGIIPLPAPATVELLSGFQIYGGTFEGEWATPTGSAILKSIACECNPIPAMKIIKSGYGAGSEERPIPNVLRIIMGDDASVQNAEEDQMILETNIDDMNPELFGYLGELLLKAGAKDFYFTSVLMKKGRPGIQVTVVVSPEKTGVAEEILLKETTTLGIRKYPVKRRCLERNHLTVNIAGLEVRVKTAWQDGVLFNYAPEYEDCVKAATSLAQPLKDIYEMAKSEARIILKNRGAF